MNLLERLLMALFPRTFRKRYGRELRTSLRQALADAGERPSTARRLQGRAGVLIDYLHTAIAERFTALRRSRLLPSPNLRPSAGTVGRSWFGTGELLHDLRQAWRQLLLAPGFTVATVLILALGISANTAVFGLFNAALLKTPPVRDPERLVALWRSGTPSQYGSGLISFSWIDYLDVRSRSRTFDDIAAYGWLTSVVRAGAAVDATDGAAVTANYFSVLGVKPQLGRAFLPEEGSSPGTAPVIVLSDAFWNEHLDRAPDVIGTTVHVSGVPLTVVGIAPAGFRGTHTMFRFDFWVPATMFDVLLPASAQLSDAFSQRENDWLYPVGRLAAHVELAAARSEMRAIATRLDWVKPSDTIQLDENIGMHPSESSELRSWATFALAIAGLVLALACANVASLVLARATNRRRDLAIRLAIGCGPRRLVRLLAMEGVLLAAAAGAAALATTVALRRTLPRLIPYYPHATSNLDLAPDLRVMGYTALACGLGWCLFALAPALQASRLDLVAALKGLAGTAGRNRGSLHRLVVGQVALAVLLLVVAGLFTRSLGSVSSIDPGFETEHLLLATVNPRLSGYDPSHARTFYGQLLDEIRKSDGVEAASLGLQGPGTFAFPVDAAAAGTEGREGIEAKNSILQPVKAQYFRAAGIEIVRGRGFNLDDYASNVAGVVINETMAGRLWPDGNALGQTLTFPVHPYMGSQEQITTNVIGVARNTIIGLPEYDSIPTVWVPIDWFPTLLGGYRITLHVRTVGPPAEFVPRLREFLAELDPNLRFASVTTGDDWFRLFMIRYRHAAVFADILAALALFLSALGIYSVMSHVTHGRAHEMGVRLAIGARRRSVRRLVIGDGLRLALIGMLLGAAGAAFAGHLLAAHLYGISPNDPTAFLLAASVSIVMAILACYLPAHRAARTEPTVILRQS